MTKLISSRATSKGSVKLMDLIFFCFCNGFVKTINAIHANLGGTLHATDHFFCMAFPPTPSWWCRVEWSLENNRDTQATTLFQFNQGSTPTQTVPDQDQCQQRAGQDLRQYFWNLFTIACNNLYCIPPLLSHRICQRCHYCLLFSWPSLQIVAALWKTIVLLTLLMNFHDPSSLPLGSTASN